MSVKTMSEQAKNTRAEYARKWRKRNPGKTAEYVRRYWEKKSAEKNFDQASDEVNTDKNGD